jgi:hypothetical protein
MISPPISTLSSEKFALLKALVTSLKLNSLIIDELGMSSIRKDCISLIISILVLKGEVND